MIPRLHGNIVALALVLALAACASPGIDNAADKGRIASLRATLLNPDSPHVMVVAHRGCWFAAPENSLAAIRDCIALGVDMVELDVRRTADGVLVLMHDETVDRMTDGHGRVDEMTYAEISRLRLRTRAGGAGAPLTQEAVPTFEEAMRLVRDAVLVNLDAKADVYADAFAVLERVDAADHILMKRRVAPGDGPLAAEPPFDRVMSMAIVDQQAGTASELLLGQAQRLPAAAEFIFTDMDYGRSAAAQAEDLGLRVWINTLKPEFAGGLDDAVAVQDPDAVWGRFTEMGFDMIQTDEPKLLIDYLRQHGLRD